MYVCIYIYIGPKVSMYNHENIFPKNSDRKNVR